jgi:Mg2+ and Co2+ transporter CorA
MTSLYELSTSGELRLTDATAFPANGDADGVVRWLRLIGRQPQERRDALRALALPDDLIEQAQEGKIRSWVITHGGALLAAMPALAPGHQRTSVLRVACTETTMITAEEVALPAIDRIVAEGGRAGRSARSLQSLCIAILEAVAIGAAPVYQSLRQGLEELSDALEDHPLDVPPDDLLDMKRRVGRLSMLWEDQMHVFMDLQRHASHVSTAEGSHEWLRNLAFDSERGTKLVAQLETRLRDLRLYQTHCLQESTNRRLNLLAVLSAVYMPATLIAGIYGMNFDGIPITRVPYGYFAVLALMGAVVLGQLWIFRRRGWFR